MQPASPLQSAADLPLARQPVRELAWLIRTRAVSPVEVLDAHLKVIERLNPKLNAIVTLAADQARDAARRAESAVMKGEPLGPLHGLPVAIKDVTPTAGIRTTFASPLSRIMCLLPARGSTRKHNPCNYEGSMP